MMAECVNVNDKWEIHDLIYLTMTSEKIITSLLSWVILSNEALSGG
jgi:hypothetical protein